jgi:hypothetical protein
MFAENEQSGLPNLGYFCCEKTAHMAKDKYHELVKQALIDDGWTITHDPLRLSGLARPIEIDLGAEKLIGAQKGMEIIAVEIKSFLGLSELYEFYGAVGQFSF